MSNRRKLDHRPTGRQKQAQGWSFRVRQEPQGLAQVTYAYLALVLGTAAGGIVMGVAYAIIGHTPLCDTQTTAYCVPVTAGLVGAVGFMGLLFLIAWALRLGWEWAGWTVALTLLVVEVVAQTIVVWLGSFLIIVPAGAALLTWRRPSREPPRAWLVTRRLVWGLVLAQFIVWAGFLVRPV